MLILDDIGVGYVGEWDLSSVDLIDRHVKGMLDRMALSGDRIVTFTTENGNRFTQVIEVSTCLLILRRIFYLLQKIQCVAMLQLS